jgi:hypothetical protein
MKKIAIVAITALTLAGCATNDYQLYAQTQSEIATAKAYADAKRYEALSKIAQDGDSAAKVAAVMSLNNAGSNSNSSTPIQAPKSMTDKIMDWTVGLFPSAVSLWGIQKNAEVSMHNSDNARDIRIDTNGTMVDLVNGESFVSDPVIIQDADGNESAVYPEVDRP